MTGRDARSAHRAPGRAAILTEHLAPQPLQRLRLSEGPIVAQRFDIWQVQGSRNMTGNRVNRFEVALVSCGIAGVDDGGPFAGPQRFNEVRGRQHATLARDGEEVTRLHLLQPPFCRASRRQPGRETAVE